MCFWCPKKSTVQEIAKFVSGVAAVEVLNHAYLAISNVLPLRCFGFEISKNINLIILFAWSLVFVISVYRAWIKK